MNYVNDNLKQMNTDYLWVRYNCIFTAAVYKWVEAISSYYQLDLEVEQKQKDFFQVRLFVQKYVNN